MKIYQAAQVLDAEVGRLLSGKCETDDVVHLKRTLGSILFNIPEAYASTYPGTKRYHLDVVCRSADESRSQLNRMVETGFLKRDRILKASSLTSAIAKMAIAWIRALDP